MSQQQLEVAPALLGQGQHQGLLLVAANDTMLTFGKTPFSGTAESGVHRQHEHVHQERERLRLLSRVAGREHIHLRPRA